MPGAVGSDQVEALEPRIRGEFGEERRPIGPLDWHREKAGMAIPRDQHPRGPAAEWAFAVVEQRRTAHRRRAGSHLRALLRRDPLVEGHVSSSPSRPQHRPQARGPPACGSGPPRRRPGSQAGRAPRHPAPFPRWACPPGAPPRGARCVCDRAPSSRALAGLAAALAPRRALLGLGAAASLAALLAASARAARRVCDRSCALLAHPLLAQALVLLVVLDA